MTLWASTFPQICKYFALIELSNLLSHIEACPPSKSNLWAPFVREISINLSLPLHPGRAFASYDPIFFMTGKSHKEVEQSVMRLLRALSRQRFKPCKPQHVDGESPSWQAMREGTLTLRGAMATFRDAQWSSMCKKGDLNEALETEDLRGVRLGPFLDIFKNTILKLQVLLSKESMDEVRRMCKAWRNWMRQNFEMRQFFDRFWLPSSLTMMQMVESLGTCHEDLVRVVKFWNLHPDEVIMP